MEKCKTCNGTGEYKSGCHAVVCPECFGEGEGRVGNPTREEELANGCHPDSFDWDGADKGL